MLHNTPQGLPKRLPCLTSSSPGHVPPIIVPRQRKARSATSEAHWIYGTVTAIISLPLPPIIILLQRNLPSAIC